MMASLKDIWRMKLTIDRDSPPPSWPQSVASQLDDCFVELVAAGLHRRKLVAAWPGGDGKVQIRMVVDHELKDSLDVRSELLGLSLVIGPN
jgi:hypothetical protein